MQNKCAMCPGCGPETPECACGCPLTPENVCSKCKSEEVCKYCCGCNNDR